MRIKNKEIFSEMKTFSAIYVDDDGREYEIGYQESLDLNIGYRELLLNFVERDGKEVSEEDNPELWEKIKKAIL